MNTVIANIAARRSVREYQDKPLSKDALEVIVESGNMAPSGCNAQGWRFVVVTDKVFLDKLAKLALPRYKKFMEKANPELAERRKDVDAKVGDPVYYGAPAVVFVIGKPGMTMEADCPMACQNIMLAARSLGIGSCWVYFGQLVIDDAEVKKALELKEGEKVFGPILLGYPKEGFPQGPEKKPAEIKWI